MIHKFHHNNCTHSFEKRLKWNIFIRNVYATFHNIIDLKPVILRVTRHPTTSSGIQINFPNSSQIEYVISDLFVHKPILKAFTCQWFALGCKKYACWRIKLTLFLYTCNFGFCLYKFLFSYANLSVGDKLFWFRYCPCLAAIHFLLEQVNSKRTSIKIDNFQHQNCHSNNEITEKYAFLTIYGYYPIYFTCWFLKFYEKTTRHQFLSIDRSIEPKVLKNDKITWVTLSKPYSNGWE